VACDHTKKRSFKKIISAISNSVGNGKVDNIAFNEAMIRRDYDLLTLNVRLKPSALLDEAHT
jgi:hypothetical protein